MTNDKIMILVQAFKDIINAADNNQPYTVEELLAENGAFSEAINICSDLEDEIKGENRA